MKNSRHSAPEVSAGSMADIAFLLLIFFLVTTTISADKGINRKLPEICPPGKDCSTNINERNILRITINADNELFVKDKIVSFKDLKSVVKSFLDNNGDKSCDYCQGQNDVTSSDNPLEAVISLQNDQQASYEMYVAVQDELTKAYSELRATYAFRIFGKSSDNLTEKEMLKIKKAYPFILSEAETQH